MALQFILGNSGSGKTQYLYRTVLEKSEHDQRRMYYLIVPEQFTMQAQKELVMMQKNRALMNVDVVSFNRLAYRIFDELGLNDRVVLEDTGKNLILRRLAQEHRSELTALKNNVHRMGYIDQIKSLISEFMQYGFSPTDLKEYLETDESLSALHYKLQDMLLIYDAFDHYLQDRFVTSETILTELAQHVRESGLLKDAVLAFDGFTGFTPVQMTLLKELFAVCHDAYVTVCIDGEGELYADRGIQELFYLGRKTIRSLTDAAHKAGCTVADPVILDGTCGRFAENPALRFLEQNLFRTDRRRNKGMLKGCKNGPDPITVRMVLYPKDELMYAAARIRELVHTYGYRYKDIAVVSGDEQCYANYAQDVFGMFHIPFFADTKESILFHPFTEWVRAVLEILEKNFEREGVFRYLRSGLSDFTMEETDLLENYVLERGIRGYRRWNEKWVHPPKRHAKGTSLTQDEETSVLQRLNEMRERLMGQLRPIRHEIQKKDCTVYSFTTALYQLMVFMNMEEKMDQRRQKAEADGDEVKASVYNQVYRVLIDLLDKVVELLGEEQITVRDYREILEAGFQAAKIGTIPPGADCVILGDIERTRLDHIKVLFFLGLNDGIIPKHEERGSLLSQYDREKLANQKVELAPTAREQVFLQKFYLYWNMTRPSDALILTYAAADSLGTARKESYLIGTLTRLFPDLEIKEVTEEQMFVASAGTDSIGQYVKGLIMAKEEKILPAWKALYKYLMGNPVYSHKAEELFEAAFACYDGEKLSPELARNLYGTVLYNSVTRIEQFVRCAYAHFLEYGLRLAKRAEFIFEPADMGMLFHGALEAYGRGMKEAGLNWFTVTRQQQDEILKQAVSDTILGMDTSVLEDSSRGAYMVERIRRILSRSVWALTEQVRRGSFHPYAYEVGFSREVPLKHIQGGRMYVNGRIDRVDTYGNGLQLYVKVMDYKSGHHKFKLLDLYRGLQLQLITYLNAALSGLKNEYPDCDIIPAGILYYHMDDPMIEAPSGMMEQELHQAMLEALRPDGIVSSDKTAIELMDNNLEGRSCVIPVTLKKDGELSSRGTSAVSRKQFGIMGKYAEKKIQNSAEKILDGVIRPYPVLTREEDGCQYCPFHSVCRFDPRIPGYEKNRPEELSDEELWKRMEQEAEDESNLDG